MLLAWLLTQPVGAEVTVLANRTVATISIEIVRGGELPKNLTIPSGDSLPVFFQGSLQVRFGEGLRRQQYLLQAGSAYFFARGADAESLELEQIGIGEEKATPSAPAPSVPTSMQPVTITVKLLVDENEPTHRRIWEPKLRKRIAAASKILERHSGVRLKVVAVATWESDEKRQHFGHSLREFELAVRPQPAQLAIGFSSQYQASRGRSHLGVTRWPMHSHILLRERSRNLLETERLELLVHELGHYLGASHSPEPQSVMRPVLTRGPQRGVGSRIQFDPVNALLVALTGDEMRRRGVRSVRDLSKPTVARMKQIYGVLKQAMPHDPAAQQYLRILQVVSAPPQKAKDPVQQKASVSPLVADTRQLLGHLLKVAQESNGEREASLPIGQAVDVTGDELTDFYVRQAGLAASRLRPINAKRSLLLALGIFMDDTDTLRSFPGTGDFINRVESEEQRTERVSVMGTPTMRERSDLTKHFFASAYLVVVMGKPAAVSAGLAKEMIDSQGGTGFSFVDMAVNRAGIVFAERLLAGELPVASLARGFYVDDYLPTLIGLDEGLSAVDLQAQFGGPDQPTIDEQLELIEQRVLELPIYDQPERLSK